MTTSVTGSEDVGVITMAFGSDKYYRQAETLARSLKRHMPELPLALVCDRIPTHSVFDHYIDMPPFDVAGTLLKLEMFSSSPFTRTLFIDSDCVVTRPFVQELAEIAQFEFTPIVSRYLYPGEKDLWIGDLAKALDSVGAKAFPKFNGGVYFFQKGPTTEAIKRVSSELLNKKAELTLIDFDAAGPGEETLIGLALGQLGLSEFYDDKGRLMRTPLNMIGPLWIDALGGGCKFNKEGAIVEPAICHFCGPWASSPEYVLATEAIWQGRPPSPFRQATLKFGHRLDTLVARGRRKLARVVGHQASAA